MCSAIKALAPTPTVWPDLREAESQYIADRDASIQADSWETVCGMVRGLRLRPSTHAPILPRSAPQVNLKEVANPIKDTSRMRQILVQLKHK